jgi:hypothetical protein
VRRTYYREYYQLRPPKTIWRPILGTTLSTLKHKKAIKDFIVAGGDTQSFPYGAVEDLQSLTNLCREIKVLSTAGSDLHLVKNVLVNPLPTTCHICQLCPCCTRVSGHLNAITIRSHTTAMVC